MSNHDSYSDTHSPRTELSHNKTSCLTVRPEVLEGRTADYDTVSKAGRGKDDARAAAYTSSNFSRFNPFVFPTYSTNQNSPA